LATVRGIGLLTPKSKWTWVPVPCFLVEHPTAGPFLIDTGLPPAASHDVRAALGRRAAIVYDIRMEDGWAVTDQLVSRGLDPLGIGLVVLTHMHQDHVGAVAQLPRATFIVDGANGRGDRQRLLCTATAARSTTTTTTGARSTSAPSRWTPSPPSATRSTSSPTACVAARRPATRRGT
jgi:glyoxylase-like metal-dependent hydrolase (beta-lactamase superfamily II)